MTPECIDYSVNSEQGLLGEDRIRLKAFHVALAFKPPAEVGQTYRKEDKDIQEKEPEDAVLLVLLYVYGFVCQDCAVCLGILDVVRVVNCISYCRPHPLGSEQSSLLG